jgi:hypothetical protein
VWAFLGAPLLFSVVLNSAYRAAVGGKDLGFLSPFNESTWWLAIGACAISGVLALWQLSFKALWQRIGICVLYASGIVAALLFIGLNVACSNGDCV